MTSKTALPEINSPFPLSQLQINYLVEMEILEYVTLPHTANFSAKTALYSDLTTPKLFEDCRVKI